MSSNTPSLDKLKQQYKNNPTSVPHAWQVFFAKQEGKEPPKAPRKVATPRTVAGVENMQNHVSHYIQAYRSHGHKIAKLDPLGLRAQHNTDLDMKNFGLDDSHLSDTFVTDGILPSQTATLKEIKAALEKTYASSIGVEFNVSSLHERQWLQTKMEAVHNHPSYSKPEKVRIAEGLMRADSFENFLHTKYVGVKRFSVEGGDAIIPMMDRMCDQAGEYGVEDVVFGMAHRGRLNVLANIMMKPLEEIFAAFNDNIEIEDDFAASGDVKYHMGKSYDITTKNGHKLHLSLLNNPSHLEAVDPVVVGSARAKQTLKGFDGATKVLPVMFHGDASFSGQGVVPETLNLSNLNGYSTGGTVHIVINNQVGFTANKEDTASGDYCTDVAKILQVPIFHVNGDDAEACVHVMQLAMEWRTKFKKDVVIDLVCYRRYGHNEGDDPTFTQPQMYSEIKQHKTPVNVYMEEQTSNGSLTEADLATKKTEYTNELQAAFDKAKKEGAKVKPDMFGGAWENFGRGGKRTKTEIKKEVLNQVANAVTAWPEGFTPHPKVEKTLEKRVEMLKGEAKLDWGSAEIAAYGSLLSEGYNVRISGQDVQRGTFSHRHVASIDNNTGERCIPLTSLTSEDTYIEAWNSPLSEYAVLGFEYGYSLADPKTLTIWEAQFGDFANGAQIMFDQFISSSEVKWHRMSGLVVLLPHGFEGMGPEHSSARLERYLQLCAENNMTVINPTTPAQIFHVLRRQMHRPYRRPLIVMTPKSLLRHPMAVSDASELTSGSFKEVILDDENIMKKAKKVAFCSGKIYYDLLARREETKDESVALIRIEQLYPLYKEQIADAIKLCKKAKKFMWVQEDPRNQGAWTYLQDAIFANLPQKVEYVGRDYAASPAPGSAKVHKLGQERIIDAVFS